MEAGDKCLNCHRGYMEKITISASVGGSLFNLMTLGLAGDDSDIYYKCTNCKKEVNS